MTWSEQWEKQMMQWEEVRSRMVTYGFGNQNEIRLAHRWVKKNESDDRDKIDMEHSMEIILAPRKDVRGAARGSRKGWVCSREELGVTFIGQSTGLNGLREWGSHEGSVWSEKNQEKGSQKSRGK